MSLPTLIALKDRQRPRVVSRVHRGGARARDKRKGFTEADYYRLLGDVPAAQRPTRAGLGQPEYPRQPGDARTRRAGFRSERASNSLHRTSP